MRIIFLLCICIIFKFQNLVAQDDIKLKANYLSRFANNISWPSSAIGNDFLVGVVAKDDVFQNYKAALDGNLVSKINKRIEVRQIQSYEEADDCPVLFIANARDRGTLLLSKLASSVGNKPILIVTEEPGLLNRGIGIDVNLVKVLDSKWEYELNPDQIKRRKLIANANLLDNARNKNDVVANNNPKTDEKPNVINRTVYKDDPRTKEELKKIMEEKKKLETTYTNFLNDPKLTEAERKKYQAQLDTLLKQKDIYEAVNQKITAENKQKDAENKQRIAEATALREQSKARDAARQTQLAILVGILLLISVLTLVFYYSNIRRKKVIEEVKKARNELADKVDEINQKNKEINMKNDQLTEQTLELEEQNRKITDSIRYALTIQQALLPGDQQINALFSEHFIIYMPKDIVSGDFYWINKSEDLVYVAVVDCTGHGVPGAFMSTIGADILNEIVNKNTSINPSAILELLHLGIFEKLRQNDTNNRDGMDVCLCAIKVLPNQTFQVVFSGAKRPLYYTHQNQLHRISGDSKYIGGIRHEKQEFTNHEVLLQKGDILYLTTDGYVDTPNPQRKKIGSQKFQEILEQEWQKPLHLQKQILLDILDAHLQDTPLRDDITIMGVKL